MTFKETWSVDGWYKLKKNNYNVEAYVQQDSVKGQRFLCTQLHSATLPLTTETDKEKEMSVMFLFHG